MPRKETVTKIIDGDTFMTASRKKPVRLADLDTPEKGQPGFNAAKNALERMLLNQDVTIDTVARDNYGRSVAKVKVGRFSVNKAMKKFEQ